MAFDTMDRSDSAEKGPSRILTTNVHCSTAFASTLLQLVKPPSAITDSIDPITGECRLSPHIFERTYSIDRGYRCIASDS